MQITQLAGRPAAIDLLTTSGAIDRQRFDRLTKDHKNDEHRISSADRDLLNAWEADVGRWATWFQCAFLFGAATGGLVFGRLGDWIGRSKAMAASIVVYS